MRLQASQLEDDHAGSTFPAKERYASVTYRIRSMTADDIPVLTAWHYPPPYDFYDPDADEDDLAELSDPGRWGNEYFTAIDDQQEIVGFFQFRLPEPGVVIEIGLGMRPDLTGIGLGSSYLAAGMDFARERWHRESFQLFVAAFNLRAIKVYERLGFHGVEELRRFTGGAWRDFVRMEHPRVSPETGGARPRSLHSLNGGQGRRMEYVAAGPTWVQDI